MNRRNFLKKSLIAAGMVAAPTTLISRVIAEPVDPAKEYHLDICRDVYRQYPLTPRECYPSLVKKYAAYYDQQQLAWLRFQNAGWQEFEKKGPIKYLKTHEQA